MRKRRTSLGWESMRYSYYIAHTLEQMEVMMNLPTEEQKQYLEERGAEVIYSI